MLSKLLQVHFPCHFCYSYDPFIFILQMIKMGRSVETILRENVLQAEHVGENNLGNVCMENMKCVL